LSVVPQLSFSSFWHTGHAPATGLAMLESIHARAIPVLSPAQLCGRVLRFGQATVRVLAPCPDVREHESANDNSYVIRIDLGQRRALLMGDAEAAQERRILSLGTSALRSDLLKVGHHGSRNATTAPFLDAVRPAIAVITSGIRNRHGHPTPEVLTRLRARGVRVLRSDLHGAVRWETDGDHWRVETCR
jgi:beta-lactamase superfamily II metal-dependent hydrolase